MDIHLTQEDAESLISCLKRTLVDTINAPEKGKNLSFDVESVSMNPPESFVVSIFRGRINRSKISYNARIKLRNTVLLELHLNPTNKHMNPDGTIVSGSHWHIYREGYGIMFAFPADDIQTRDFVENTIVFLKRFNIINNPNINEQLEI